MEHLIQPIPGPQCCRMQSRWHCSAGKKMSALSRTHVTFTHTIFHKQLCHTHTHTYIHTYVRTYIHTYVHTYMHTIFSHTFLLCHTHSLSPPPLSFLPSPSPLQPLKLSIGRSWLVGFSGPLILLVYQRVFLVQRLALRMILLYLVCNQQIWSALFTLICRSYVCLAVNSQFCCWILHFHVWLALFKCIRVWYPLVN